MQETVSHSPRGWLFKTERRAVETNGNIKATTIPASAMISRSRSSYQHAEVSGYQGPTPEGSVSVDNAQLIQATVGCTPLYALSSWLAF